MFCGNQRTQKFIRHACVIAVLIVACSVALFARQDREGHTSAVIGLGEVHFPISCSEGLQQQFEAGVALLHSFWYGRANKAFMGMEEQDPHCAMAYWGEAMSLYSPFSGPPRGANLKRGRAALEKALPITSISQRERDYITALSLLYADSDKPADSVAVAAYVSAMERLYKTYSDDREAAAFYGLVLFATSIRNDPGLVNRRGAAAILEKVLAAEPNHPGAAHYLVHVYDCPQLAPLGLAAARRYAQIAPASPHALHMPSHIFNRLGLWKESIDSNLGAVAAARAMENIDQQMHPMDFLDYAYLQIGREDKALALLEEIKGLQQPAATSYMLGLLPARHAVELHDWKTAAALETQPGSDSWTREITYWARVIGAARSGTKTAAHEAFEELTKISVVLGKKDPQYTQDSDVYFQEAAAWLAYADGDAPRAMALLRATSDLQDKAAGDQVTVPAREMLGDLRVAMKQGREALAEYESALGRAPDRFDSVYGAAVAADLAGDSQKSRKYADDLLRLCDGGRDSARPELAWARQKTQGSARLH
jgi:tetratricopeptide (TPR) repeat protein